MSLKICIITPGTIASNPRVVKEAEALSEAGYKIHLIYTRHAGYLIDQDECILRTHPEWTSDHLDWTGLDIKSKRIKFFSGIKRRAANIILKSGFYPNRSAGFLLNRFYYWQLKHAILFKADLYIAHYPDSIAIAAEASIRTGSLFAFDAEDYHRGEDIPQQMIRAISIIENHFLRNAAYISAASPMIAEAYKKLFPAINVYSFENSFALKRQVPFVELQSDIFKFFWFSQTIGPKRGLEEFISILGLTGEKNIQLTLLGNCASDYKKKLKALWLNNRLKPDLLVILPTVPENEIFRLAAEHHFGLALEIPHSLNRNICLTNKLYTYILSGNLLILSNTQSQKDFHTRFNESGICIDLKTPQETSKQIMNLLSDHEINNKRKSNFELGRKTVNFDLEKKKLLQVVKQIRACGVS